MKFHLIYFKNDMNNFKKKLLNFVEMKVISEPEFEKFNYGYLYEISDTIKEKNLKMATEYYKNLYKNSEDIRIN